MILRNYSQDASPENNKSCLNPLICKNFCTLTHKISTIMPFNSILTDPVFLAAEKTACTCCHRSKHHSNQVHFNKHLSYETKRPLKIIISANRPRPHKSVLKLVRKSHKSEAAPIPTFEPMRRRKPVVGPNMWIIDKPTIKPIGTSMAPPILPARPKPTQGSGHASASRSQKSTGKGMAPANLPARPKPASGSHQSRPAAHGARPGQGQNSRTGEWETAGRNRPIIWGTPRTQGKYALGCPQS